VPRELITLAQAAHELGLSVRTVHRMLADGRLRPFKYPVDRRIYVDRADVRRLLKPRVLKRPAK